MRIINTVGNDAVELTGIAGGNTDQFDSPDDADAGNDSFGDVKGCWRGRARSVHAGRRHLTRWKRRSRKAAAAPGSSSTAPRALSAFDATFDLIGGFPATSGTPAGWRSSQSPAPWACSVWPAWACSPAAPVAGRSLIGFVPSANVLNQPTGRTRGLFLLAHVWPPGEVHFSWRPRLYFGSTPLPRYSGGG